MKLTPVQRARVIIEMLRTDTVPDGTDVANLMADPAVSMRVAADLCAATRPDMDSAKPTPMARNLINFIREAVIQTGAEGRVNAEMVRTRRQARDTARQAFEADIGVTEPDEE